MLPIQPLVTAPATVLGNSQGYLACAREPIDPAKAQQAGYLPPPLMEPGVTYTWTISYPGELPEGNEGNQITFSAGAKGRIPLTLTCTATNAAGWSSQGSATVTVFTGP